MKTFLSTALFLVSFIATSQSWCDIGANWRYSYMNGFGTEGYTKIQYIGDTTISGQPAKILDKHIYAYDYVLSQSVDFDLGQEYTYENSGVVYRWYNNSWDTLYNFNATIGESWRMAKQPMTNACDSNGVLSVTATGTKIINSITLNYLVVEFNYGGSMSTGITDTIVQKIGFIGGYMLPYDGCDGALDVNEGGAFRCYEDNNFTSYKPHYAGICDFIVGLDKIDSESYFQIVPNPASTKIELIGLDNYNVISIQDLRGKSWAFIQDGSTININDLPNGIYVLSVRNEHRVQHERFIKQ